MKISISWKIFLGVVIVQIITAASIIAWYFNSIRPEVNNIVVQNTQESVLRSIQSTENYFGPVETAIRATRRLLSQGVLSRERPDQLIVYLHDQLRLWPQFAGVYVGYANGDFYYVMRDDEQSASGTRTKIVSHDTGSREVDLTWRDADYTTVRTASDPEDTYDPRTRPWYLAAIENGGIVWTDPYIFFTSRKPGITAAITAGSADDQPEAVVGIDLEIGKVSQYLRQIAFGQQRSAFLITPEGEIISHSDINTVIPGDTAGDDGPGFLKLPDWEGLEPAIRDGIMTQLSERSNADVPSVWQEQSDDGEVFVALGRIPSENWPWQIAAILPEAGGAGSKSGVILVTFVLIATAMAIAVGYMLARSIGRPVVILRNNARLARNGNVELMDDVNSRYEEINETAGILKELGDYRRQHAPSGSRDRGKPDTFRQ